MELHKRLNDVRTQGDLAVFVDALRDDLLQSPDEWENPTLERYLEAMSAYIRDNKNLFENPGKPIPVEVIYRLVADVLYAARSYE
jgi:hypothetical protein